MGLAPLWDAFLPQPDPRDSAAPPPRSTSAAPTTASPIPPRRRRGAAAAEPRARGLACGSAACGGRAPGRAGGVARGLSELQRETAAAHAAWQETTTRTHLASCSPWSAPARRWRGLRGCPRRISVLPAATLSRRRFVPIGAGVRTRRPSRSSLVRQLSFSPSRRPRQALPEPFLEQPVGRGSPRRSARVAAAAREPAGILATLLVVVAEKTGYPVDLLRPEMALEADLGIDSVKRVEILSALEERLPALAQLEPAALTEMRTLGDIVSRLDAAGCGTARLVRAGRGAGRDAFTAGGTPPAAPAARRSRRAAARGRGGEDRLPGRAAHPGDGARGRPGHRLDQADRDPLRARGPAPRRTRSRLRRGPRSCACSATSSSTCGRGRPVSPLPPIAGCGSQPRPRTSRRDVGLPRSDSDGRSAVWQRGNRGFAPGEVHRGGRRDAGPRARARGACGLQGITRRRRRRRGPGTGRPLGMRALLVESRRPTPRR